MSITRLAARTCRICGKELTDAVSRRFRVGPDCRKTMTGEQLRAAAALTKAEADPGYIPPTKAATAQALHTNAAARQTVAQAEAPKVCEPHGGLIDQCPLCRRPTTAAQAAEMLADQVARYIRQVHVQRRAARDATR